MRYLAFSAVGLAGCGGGGGAGLSTVPALPTVPRGDVPLVCYFASDAGAAAWSADHTNCLEVLDWEPVQQMAALMQAGDRKVILGLPACRGLPVDRVEPELTFWLQRLQDAHHLDHDIVAVRPCDEPDDKGMGDAEVLARLAATRAAMAKFAATAGKPITLYYVCSSGRRPGIDAVDWIGCDAKEIGPDVFPTYYPALERYVDTHPGKRLAAIMYGAAPFRTTPEPMVARVMADQRYVLAQGFIAQTITDGGITYIGIKDQADMAASWRGAYQRVLH